MISKDDEPITPVTFNSDTCYYFDANKKYTHKELCTTGIRPRGSLKNIDGLNFDFDFRFSDPTITPRTLTLTNLQDGEYATYGSTNEPLINKAMLMNKNLLFGQLAEAIVDQNGKEKPSAFDYHIFAPWSLYQGSTGSLQIVKILFSLQMMEIMSLVIIIATWVIFYGVLLPTSWVYHNG